MTSFPVLNNFNGFFVNLYTVSEQAVFSPLGKKLLLKLKQKCWV